MRELSWKPERVKGKWGKNEKKEAFGGKKHGLTRGGTPTRKDDGNEKEKESEKHAKSIFRLGDTTKNIFMQITTALEKVHLYMKKRI